MKTGKSANQPPTPRPPHWGGGEGVGNGLEKTLSPVDAVMIVVGNVIGVGIFTTTGFIAGDLPDAFLIIAAWLIGGCLTLFGASSYGELGSAFPRAGGDYIYLKEAYGPIAGFLVGWMGFFIINPGSIAALSLGLSGYLLPLLPLGLTSPVASKLTAIFAIFVFSGLNYFSVPWTSRVQNTVSSLNLLIIVFIIGVGFIWGNGDFRHFDFVSETASVGDVFGPAMVSVFFTYSGWFVSAYVAGEMKNPEKTLPLSLIASSIIVTVLYCAMNALYIYALPIPDMKGVVDIARRACDALIGSRISVLFSVMIIFAILGSLNSVILTAPRIYFAMAKDGLFPKALGFIHPKYKTPHWAIIVQAGISCLMVIAGNFYQLLSYTVFFMLLSSIATAVGLFVLRHNNSHLHSPYKAWGYPFTTIIFIAAYAWIAVRIFSHNPHDAIIGIFIMLTGIPFYIFWKKSKSKGSNQ